MIRKAWSFADRVYSKGECSEPIPDDFRPVALFKVKHDIIKAWANESELFISMRGSDDFFDWWDNISQTPWGGLENFIKVYLDFKGPVLELCKRYLNYKITLTAHSRGCPPIQWLAKDIGEMIKQCSCISFACPDHLTKEQRDEFNLAPVNYTNIINPGDIVATSIFLKGFGLKKPGKDCYLPGKWTDWIPFKREKQHMRKYYWPRIKKRFK